MFLVIIVIVVRADGLVEHAKEGRTFSDQCQGTNTRLRGNIIQNNTYPHLPLSLCTPYC